MGYYGDCQCSGKQKLNPLHTCKGWGHSERQLGFYAVVIISVGVLIAFPFMTEYGSNIKQTKSDISNLNCHQLAEYIADKKSVYDYAEHRYEWLCVNEQVKEFQG